MTADDPNFGARSATAGHGLSTIQKDILGYVAQGWTRQQIARRTGLPPDAVGRMFGAALRVLSGDPAPDGTANGKGAPPPPLRRT